MITIQSYSKTNNSALMREINQEDSILIIGQGSSESKLNEIHKPNGIWDMTDKFGESELTTAYSAAIKSGADNVFVMNCYKTTDYIDGIRYVSHYNFAYIVPIGIKLSDSFYDGDVDKDIYFAEHYLNEFGSTTSSLIIFTDEHASLYENISAYLSDMHSKIAAFKERTNYLLMNYGRSLAFCTNNLKSVPYSNVILAVTLSKTQIGSYPDNISVEAIFDLDGEDVLENEIIYFKNNFHTPTSIENLKNFRTIFDANKLIAIDRVIKHIERTLDTSFVLGKLFSQYVKMLLHDYLDMFFRRLLATAIKNYCINDIRFIKDENMSGYIVTDISIHPMNSLENINALLEVK